MSENFVETNFYLHLQNMIKSSFKNSLTAIALFSAMISVARQGPPEPLAPTPPPGLPIDDNLILLFAVLILFGMYTIYMKKQKTSN